MRRQGAVITVLPDKQTLGKSLVLWSPHDCSLCYVDLQRPVVIHIASTSDQSMGSVAAAQTHGYLP